MNSPPPPKNIPNAKLGTHILNQLDTRCIIRQVNDRSMTTNVKYSVEFRCFNRR